MPEDVLPDVPDEVAPDEVEVLVAPDEVELLVTPDDVEVLELVAPDDVLVLLDQILVDAWAAVALLALVERCPDQDSQATIRLRMRRLRAIAPGIEATG